MKPNEIASTYRPPFFIKINPLDTIDNVENILTIFTCTEAVYNNNERYQRHIVHVARNYSRTTFFQFEEHSKPNLKNNKVELFIIIMTAFV